MELAFIADNTTNTEEPPQPAPLSLKSFADSLHHAERADNYFKFLRNFSEEELATFVQELFRQVGDAQSVLRTASTCHR